MCPCLTMHRSFALFRATLRVQTLETIYENIYDFGVEKESWTVKWYAARDDGWGQWSIIDEPIGPPDLSYARLNHKIEIKNKY